MISVEKEVVSLGLARFPASWLERRADQQPANIKSFSALLVPESCESGTSSAPNLPALSRWRL